MWRTERVLLALLAAAAAAAVAHGDAMPTTIPTVQTSILWSLESYTGTIPTEVGGWTKIKWFDIGFNQLTGSIPTEIGLMTAMKTKFSVENNYLTGTVPSELGQFTELQGQLALNNMQLSGQLPTEFGRLTAMTYSCSARSNVLTGSIPSEIGQLQMETGFYLSNNNFTVALPTEIGQLSSLKTALYMSKVTLPGSLPTQIGQLDKMRSLFSLYANDLTGTLPTEFGRLSLFNSGFYFRNNHFEGPLPTEFGTMTHLTLDFVVRKNHLTGPLPSELGLLDMQRGIYLAENEITGPIPSEFGLLVSLTSALELYGNVLTSSIPTELGKLTSILNYMQLGENALTSTIPTEFGSLSMLRSDASLHDNSLTSTIPTELGTWLHLTTGFQLGKNVLTGSLPTELAALTAMVSGLEVHSNVLTGTLMTELGLLTSLTEDFKVHGNRFTSSIPTQLGRLSLLTSAMRLGNNRFTSTVPTQFGQLVELTATLHLSQNELSGRVPSELGSLSMRDSLQLHSNAFFGTLPSELGSFYLLTNGYELQVNKLCGDIPTEVSALSYGITSWNLTLGNDLGTDCCETIPEAYTCVPTSSPTSAPTELCGRGAFYSRTSGGCTACPAGTYRNSTDAPVECLTCPIGTYRTYSSDPDDALACDDCPSGRVSASDFSSCETCDAGQYTLNSTTCEDCQTGRYAPTAQDGACLSCAEGSYTGTSTKATSCNSCEAGKYSSVNSKNCTTCAPGKYSSSRSESCTTCAAGTFTSPNGGASSCTNCGVGRYQAHNASTSCDSCPPGTYQSGSGQASCADCVEGYFTDSNGSTSCDKCTAEYGDGYTSTAGSHGCFKCLEDYVRHKGKCHDCPTGAVCEGTGTTTDNLQIEPGYWRHSNDTLKVLDCPRDDVSCHGGNSSTGLCRQGSFGPYCDLCEAGWFRPTADSKCTVCPDSFVETWQKTSGIARLVLLVVFLAALFYGYKKLRRACKDNDQAPNTVADDAAVQQQLVAQPSQVGLLAAADEERTGSSVELTEKRAEEGLQPVGERSLSAKDHLKEVEEELEHAYEEAIEEVREFIGVLRTLKTQFKIMVQTTQIMGSWGFNMTFIKFPAFYQSTVGTLGSMFSVDLWALFPTLNVCQFDQRHNLEYYSLVFTTMTPILIAAGLGIWYMIVELMVKDSTPRLAQQDALALLFFLMTFCVFPSCSTAIFLFFQVDSDLEDASGECYLVSDYGTRCDNETYDLMCGYAAVMILVYPIGIPLLYFSVLQRERPYIDPALPDGTRPRDTESDGYKQILAMRAEDQHLQKYTFLFDSYEPQYWWFEAYETIRRLVLSSVSVLLWPGSIKQGVLTLFLSLTSLKVFSYTQPYVNDADDFLAEVSQWMLVCTLIWLLCIHDGDVVSDNLAGAGLLIFTLATVIIGLLSGCGAILDFFLARSENFRARHWEHSVGPFFNRHRVLATLCHLLGGFFVWACCITYYKDKAEEERLAQLAESQEKEDGIEMVEMDSAPEPQYGVPGSGALVKREVPPSFYTLPLASTEEADFGPERVSECSLDSAAEDMGELAL